MSRLGDFVNVSKGERDIADMWFIPLDPNTGVRLDQGTPNNPPPASPLRPARLQYWPESVNWDSGETGWSQKNFPGLSHGLVNWTHGGNPTVSFDITITSDIDPAYEDAMEDVPGAIDLTKRRNVDVEAAVTYFNAFQLPRYKSVFNDTSGRPVQPPPVIQLVPEFIPMVGEASFEGGGQDRGQRQSMTDFSGQVVGGRASTFRGINLSNQAYTDFYAVVADISTSYESGFSSGAPRIATVSISLIEVIQIGDVILPHDRRKAVRIAETFEMTET